MAAFTEMDLLGGPPITEPVFTLNTIKTLVDTFKLFTNISHVFVILCLGLLTNKTVQKWAYNQISPELTYA